MFYILTLSANLSGFRLFRKDTIATLNKKPMSIHNEWAQTNSFPWCEIVLSTCNRWWLFNDKKHLHAFLINLSSLKATKSLYASDCSSSETGNDGGAIWETPKRAIAVTKARDDFSSVWSANKLLHQLRPRLVPGPRGQLRALSHISFQTCRRFPSI